MDQQSLNPNGQTSAGPGGRRLHIAHRRSPSELTPLMVEQLALQQQIEMLQAQQQQMFQNSQYGGMGMLQNQSHIPPGFNNMQFPQMGMNPQQNFQFPPQQNSAPQGAPTQPSAHRRNVSALPAMGAANGPPPAPSSGTAGGNFGEFSMPSAGPAPRRPNNGPGGPPGGGGGHQRRHSLALPEAKRAAELAQQRRGQTGFQFPAPGDASSSTSANTTSSATDLSTAPSTVSQALPTQGNIQNAGGPPRPVRTGHGRSQSLAVGMAGGRPNAGGRLGAFQFPPQSNGNDSGINNNNPSQQSQQAPPSGNVERRGSNSGFQGHARTGSRNYQDNWRTPNQNQQPMDTQNQNAGQFNQGFQPGHRSRASVGGSLGSFQFPPQPNLMMPGATGQGLFMNPGMVNPGILSPQQIAQLQQAALGVPQLGLGLQPGQGIVNQQQQQQQQQQRKTLFTPYLPQANLPALLGNGHLVSGILRVNKKNRSDAYVSTQDGLLDADIFICGSKDRNRALEGDLVAVELLDVDDVWGQKREKEEKKRRKDVLAGSDGNTRGGSISSPNDAVIGGDSVDQAGQSGGMRRRGSLRQRPTQKKNDDVEVEGQSLLLVEEEEINDEQKPLYAGHVVAVIERVAGQMFSGTLGLLRPSSQATKEKQEAERVAREGYNSRPQNDRAHDKPKIVWFKPTDKRVPLIAIPTEQAPRDFVEKHESYKNRIFVACIKRWPITSLHPFGTLVEMLGEMGDLKVETDALLRDNNFGPDEFSDAVLRSITFDDWSVETEAEEVVARRRDFRGMSTFSILPKFGDEAAEISNAFHVNESGPGLWEVGVHIADVTHFVKPNTLVDREAKKRGTAVELVNRYVPMLPTKLGEDLVSFKPGAARFAYSVVFTVDEDGVVQGEPWIGKSIVQNDAVVSYNAADSFLTEAKGETNDELRDVFKILSKFAQKSRQQRYGVDCDIPALRLLYQTDDENVPNTENVFETRLAYEISEEILIRTNSFIAEKIVAVLPTQAMLRRQSPPMPRRLATFGNRINRLDYNIDISSSAALMSGLFKLEDTDVRKGVETLLVKSLPQAKFFPAGKLPAELRNHYVYNLPVYTHGTNPIGRYIDIIVQRQLEVAISNGVIEFTEDVELLSKTADQCNVKKDSAKNAKEQSIHIELCRAVDKRLKAQNGELICEAIVICVYESAFDVLIPEYGFEKRVHCDQLPLQKAEFDKTKRVLELYWEKGVQSNVYIPEDERPKGGAAMRAANEAAAARDAVAKAKADEARDEAQRQAVDVAAISIGEVNALFDDDDEEVNTDESEGEDTTPSSGASNASLSAPAGITRPTQSMPGTPTKNSPTTVQTPHRTRSDPKMSVSAQETKSDGAGISARDKYLDMFTLREEDGEYVQEVRELTRVPVYLKTELSKSPPCLTIRSLNPFAL